MKVLITGSSKFPVPAVKGGAVPNLIEEIIQQQEEKKYIELSCCSLWDVQAEKEAEKYSETSFIWAKVPKYIDVIDKTIMWILKNFFRMKRLLSVSFLFQVIWFTFFLAKILKKNDYDYIIFENSIPMLFALKLYGNKKKYQDKYFVHMHSVPRKYYGNEKIFSQAKGIITVSRYVADAILDDRRINLDENKINVMYNCIDIEKIRPINDCEIKFVKERYGIDYSKRVILFTGRLCQEKGIEQVLQMVQRISLENVILLVVGANFYKSGIVSPYEEYLQQMSEPLKDKIIFTGYIDYGEMASIYSISDVVVLPSMWEEPAGMTIIEAMACGKPVVTTVSGGIPEYTGEETCILLHRGENIVEELCAVVERVLNDEIYAAEIANRSFNRAVRYNKEFYYQQFIDILYGGDNEKI